MNIPFTRRLAMLCGLGAALSLPILSVPVLAHPNSGEGPFGGLSLGALKQRTVNFAHAKSGVVSLNKPMPNFAAPTLSGDGLSKASFKGKMGLFLMADTQCPCVQAVEERVGALAKKFSSQGLRVAYVFSNPSEKPLKIGRFMRYHQIPFPAIIDRDQRMLKMLNGKCSSEVYLTDKQGILRYHGRVDDSTFDPKAVKSRDLEKAIVALTQGKKVPRASAPAMGCAIPRI